MRNASRKKGIWDSIFALLDFIYKIVVLNLLIIVPAFSLVIIYSFITSDDGNSNDLIMYLTFLPIVIYMFPAITASINVYKIHLDDPTNKGVFKEFFKSFKKHFLKSFIISIISVLTFILFTFKFKFNNTYIYGPLLYFYNNVDNLICFMGLGLCISIIILGLIILVHLPMVMVYFDGLSLWQDLKLAFIIGFKKIGLTIVSLLVIVAFIVLDIWLYVVAFICGISLPLYFLALILHKEYIKIYRKVEEKESEN